MASSSGVSGRPEGVLGLVGAREAMRSLLIVGGAWRHVAHSSMCARAVSRVTRW